MRHFERVSSDGVVIDRAIVLDAADTKEDFDRSEIKKILASDKFYAMAVGETMPGRDNTVIRRVN